MLIMSYVNPNFCFLRGFSSQLNKCDYVERENFENISRMLEIFPATSSSFVLCKIFALICQPAETIAA